MAEPTELAPLPPKPVTPTLDRSNESETSAEKIRAERTVRQASFSREVRISIGPLPPPEILKEYNEVFSGCAERIVEMAEKQAAHRQGIERTVVDSNVGNERLGMILGFILCGTALVGGLTLLALDKSTAGFTVILGDVLTFAGSTIYLRYKQQQERKQKLEPIQTVPAEAPTPEKPS